MCPWFIQKREWFSMYMLLYQCFCCINCFSFIVEVKEISGNFSDVFGKNGKNTLYLHTHTHTHTHIYIYVYIGIKLNRFSSALEEWIYFKSYRQLKNVFYVTYQVPFYLWQMEVELKRRKILT